MNSGEPIMTALAVLFGALDVLLGFLAWRSRQRFSGLTRPAKVKVGKRNSIMLLGLGGVGKTTFVRNLFQNEEANPTVSTEHYELYETTTIVKNIGRGNMKRYTLFVGDYRGQNLGQLVREFVTQQKKPFNPMSYGFINSLVLVVDLFPPTEHFDDPPLKPRRHADADRIGLHGSQWNATALDAIFGLLTSGSLKYVCLFVNKSDLLIGSNAAEIQEELGNRFTDLQARLELRARRADAEFELVLGSAKSSAGISHVRKALFERSVEGES